MQGPGKQQKGEHAVHQSFEKIDLADGRRNHLLDVGTRYDQVENDQAARCGKRHKQQADRMRQLENPHIQPSERGRKNQEKRADFQKTEHRRPSPS